MDTLYQGILDLLNDLIPSAITSFLELNEVLAYIITISLIWGIFLRPLLKAIKVIK